MASIMLLRIGAEDHKVKRTKIGKGSLNRETIRRLDASELQRAAGGAEVGDGGDDPKRSGYATCGGNTLDAGVCGTNSKESAGYTLCNSCNPRAEYSKADYYTC
jgi:hypothetical protein